MSKPGLIGSKSDAKEKKEENPIQQVILPQTELDREAAEGEGETAIAQEPVAIGGAYLIDVRQISHSRSGTASDMQGAAGSIQAFGDTKSIDTTIELLAYNPATVPTLVSESRLDLGVRVLASTPVAADGSFRLVADSLPDEWLFLRVPAANTEPLKVDITKNEAGVAWLDLDGLLRRLDQPLAYTIHGILSPSDALKGSIARLIATGSCRGCNLAGANLSLLDISNTDLTGALLMGARFNRTNASVVRFRRADLRGADLRRSNVSGSDFRDAKLDGILLQGANRDRAAGLPPP